MSMFMYFNFFWELVNCHPVIFGMFFGLLGLILCYGVCNCCKRVNRKQPKLTQVVKEWRNAEALPQKTLNQPEAAISRSVEGEGQEGRSEEEIEPEATSGTPEEKKTC